MRGERGGREGRERAERGGGERAGRGRVRQAEIKRSGGRVSG